MRKTLTSLVCLATGLTACHAPNAANTTAATTNTTAAPTPAVSGPVSVRGAPQTADGRSAKILQQAQISAVLQQAPTTVRGSGDFVVDGDQSFDGWYLAADKIEFKPGATLTFSPQAVQSRRNFFIIANRIVSDDPQKPGAIRFSAPQVGPANASAGQAPTGRHASGGGGAAGTPGMEGTTGVTGPTGFNAPNLTLITLSIPGSGPVVDFRGGQGGAGGQGQQGGDGGNGAVGVPAAQTLFGCSHGAGRGGSGGAGGPGGAGGLGGLGGAGGTVTVMAPGDKVPTILQKIRVLTSGGPGGVGGLPGKGGGGGGGGQGGTKSLPFCQGDGQTGDNGGPGDAGGPGKPGSTGLDGDLFVGSITDADFRRLYGGS